MELKVNPYYSQRKERLSCILLYIYTFNKILCPRCFSSALYKYGHDKHGKQKYLCRQCKHQFIAAKHSPKASKSPYPKCPICGRSTFPWHRYDTYIHFKCSSKKCNHSFKLPIAPPDSLLVYCDLPGVHSFKRFRTPPHIIYQALFLYFDGNLSTRAISRFLKASIHFSVSHVSIHYWTKAFAPWFHAVSSAFMASLDLSSDEWHADETFIKIKGVTYYLWILLDSETRLVISFILSDKRDSTSAYRLFQRAASLTRASPKVIITDHLAAYAQAIATFYPNAEHYCYKDFTDDRSNNTIEAFNKTFKAWYGTKKGLKAFTSSLGLITTYIFHYNFLRQHSSLNQLPPAIVAGATYSDIRQQQWLLS